MAQKGIGRAAHTQVFRGRGVQDGLAVGAGGRQRFFAVDRLIGCQRRQGDFRMGRGHSQVDHHIDLRVSQQLCDAASFGYPKFCGLGPGSRHIDVGAGCDAHIAEQLWRFEVGGTDSATSDNPYGGVDVHRLVIASFLLNV